MKTLFALFLGVLLGTGTVIADPSTDMTDGSAKGKPKTSKLKLQATSTASSGYCYDSGSYAGCIGPIGRININSSNISFTMDLPGDELDDLSCGGNRTYANFRIMAHENENQQYEALLYAMKHNNHIRIGLPSGSPGCDVQFLHVHPAST